MKRGQREVMWMVVHTAACLAADEVPEIISSLLIEHE